MKTEELDVSHIIIETRLNDVRLIVRCELVDALSHTARVYHVEAFDVNNVRFYETQHVALRVALIDHARFIVAEYAQSTYVIDDDDETAFSVYERNLSLACVRAHAELQ